MSIRNVLFDLDGTLLPMNQDDFVKEYLKLLAARMADHGYDPQKLVEGIWAGMKAMVINDGRRTNEKAFWDVFAAVIGPQVYDDMPLFEDFYANDFCRIQSICGFRLEASETVRALKKMGLRVVLATNPVFPAAATHQRIRWAGLEPEDFELVTTYENIGSSKPNLQYYRDVLDRMGMNAEETLMVGNDVSEDMVAREIGMHVFLMTDCMVNTDNRDINSYPHGSFDTLISYIIENIRE